MQSKDEELKTTRTNTRIGLAVGGAASFGITLMSVLTYELDNSGSTMGEALEFTVMSATMIASFALYGAAIAPQCLPEPVKKPFTELGASVKQGLIGLRDRFGLYTLQSSVQQPDIETGHSVVHNSP